MTANKKNSDDSWDPETAPEIPDDAWDRAQIAIGGKIIRHATGTLTKRGRPPVGEATKQQVTLRLAPKVLAHFKATGSGWQTRMNAVLERYVSGSSGDGDRSSVRETPAGYVVPKEKNVPMGRPTKKNKKT